MNTEKIKKVVLKYDANKNIYLINDKEVEQDLWIKTKSVWELECSYNHIKRFVQKWGYTSCEIDRTNPDIDVLIFTTVQK